MPLASLSVCVRENVTFSSIFDLCLGMTFVLAFVHVRVSRNYDTHKMEFVHDENGILKDWLGEILYGCHISITTI
jgi:hypothetical protein